MPQNDGGSIIITSSVAGIVGFAGYGAYPNRKNENYCHFISNRFFWKRYSKNFLGNNYEYWLFGVLAGLILGLGLSGLIDQIPFETASLPTVKTYPIDYNPMFYIIGAVFSLITTVEAGWFPSRKASGVDPVVIIRGK